MPALAGFHHAKVPVSDVERSRDWYQRVLGFEVEIQFIEEGVLMGVGLAHPAGGPGLALRHDPARAQALSGFDLAAITVPTRAEVTEWRTHLDMLGEPHGGIVTGHKGGSVLVGLRDPDGIEIRLYAD
ncbi:VOC family protein [Dactylosporangium sp. NPDC051541]|uniref:VOC family protein n=1 Tax=Dactylosporangium sp. NPDC051541 TaxID=3363977 RepID=UPI0037AFBF2A